MRQWKDLSNQSQSGSSLQAIIYGVPLALFDDGA